MSAPRIEPATAADLDAIDEIERHSFTSPWPRAQLAAELAVPHAHIDVLRAPAVIGFNNYWLVAGELHIHAIATHPDHRRRGLGALLLGHAMARARAEGATLATLEVRRGNVPAIALYEHAGFRTTHVRKGYYQADGEDALVMLADLTRPA